MGKIKWTLEACKADALKYKSKSEWERNSLGAYGAAAKNKWLEECCGHMIRPEAHNKKKWSHSSVKKEALKFKSISEWAKKSKTSYLYALKNKILEICIAHMDRNKQINGFWDKDKCKANALKYKSRGSWQRESPSAYSAAHKKGWLEECCGHMEYITQHGKWTLGACKADALKYKSRIEWQKNSPGGYSAAQRKKWLNQCCEHIETMGGTSTPEKELQDLLKNKNPGLVFENNKKFTVLPNQKLKLNLFHVTRYELDVYIPELKLGIEFNGSYWHSFDGLKRGRPDWSNEQLKSYHSDKINYFNSLGIKIITVNEKEWEEDKSPILSKIAILI